MSLVSSRVSTHNRAAPTTICPVFTVELVASKGFVAPTQVLELPVSMSSVTEVKQALSACGDKLEMTLTIARGSSNADLRRQSNQPRRTAYDEIEVSAP